MKELDIDLTKLDDAAAKEVVKKSLLIIEDEHKAGELDDDVYTITRQRYLAYGKELLDRENEKSPKRTNVKTVAAPRSRKINRSVAISTVIAFFIAIAVLLLAGNQSKRTADEPLSGGISQSNTELIAQAGSAQSQGDLAGALKLYDRVISNDPRNVDALASRGWTLYLAAAAVNSGGSDATGFVTRSVADLDKAVAIDPQYGPARAWRGIVRYRALADSAGAVQDFDAYLATNPNDGLVDLVKQVRDQAAAAIGAPTPAG